MVQKSSTAALRDTLRNASTAAGSVGKGPQQTEVELKKLARSLRGMGLAFGTAFFVFLILAGAVLVCFVLGVIALVLAAAVAASAGLVVVVAVYLAIRLATFVIDLFDFRPRAVVINNVTAVNDPAEQRCFACDEELEEDDNGEMRCPNKQCSTLGSPQTRSSGAAPLCSDPGCHHTAPHSPH